jgi:hypothetical protein
MRKLSLAWLLTSTLLLGVSRAEEPINRRGFTLGLSLGGGATYSSPKNGNAQTQGGIGGLNLLIGGFINPNLALVGTIVGVNFGPFDKSLDHGFAGVACVAVEYWLSDHVNFLGGAGVGDLNVQQYGVENKEGGLGLLAGFNYFPFAVAHHGLGLAIDITPFFTSNFFVLTYQAGFSWQYY